ncbi:hypothetical protein [Acetobacterium malicum]|uniref:hypothetical protein n=1 Tax=Acetobacterium malicum TaxID=52692 RepID=UPI00041B2C3C|nr:hypothetical protein [Acetobacterium dehalogenans]
MKKLTTREKLLIYILGCFVIGFFGIYFVILPSYSSFQVVNDQAAEAQFTQESMVMAIDAIPSTMEARDEATVTLASMKAIFPQKLPNEGLDMLLTQLCLDYSLAPKVLSVASNGIGSVLTFIPYTSDEPTSADVGTENITTDTTTTTAETTTTTNNNDITDTTATETTDTEETTDTTIPDSVTSAEGANTLIGVVNMELTGTQANFYRLLDAVAARPDMIITAFKITPETATTGSTSTSSSSNSSSSSTGGITKLDGGKVAINVTFEVYMMEK